MEQRHFKRVHFLQGVEVEFQGQTLQTHCLDISMRGMLLVMPDQVVWSTGDELIVTLQLAPDEAIVMECAVVHVDEGVVGCLCNKTDIDSFTSLRRLLELNLANPQEVNRELAELIRTPE